MDKIKIIQIGICHEHAQGKFASLKKLSDTFEILGIVDERDFCKTPRLTEFFDENFYADSRRLTLEEALSYPGLRAVTVEVPNNDLVPIAIQCAKRNLAIHMDKPAGEDPAPFRELLKICKAGKLPFQMGFMFRGNPAFQFCIRAIRNKLLGDIFEITADMNHCYGGKIYQEYIGKFSGGLMFNLGCHLIDFVVAAMGRPERVTPFLKTVPGSPEGCRNNCMAVLEYPHTLVTLRSCGRDLGNTGERAVKIAGTNGTIRFSPVERFDGKGIELSLHLAREAGDFPAGRHTLIFPPQQDRYEVQLLELAEAIRAGTPCAYSCEHDELVHEVTLAAADYIRWR